MGCYDEVNVPCPNCGQREPFQSKGGDCAMRTYDLERCPLDVLSDVNRHGGATCRRCGTLFHVGLGGRSEPWTIDEPDEIKEEE
jgi:hypothetical protein